MVWLNDSKTGSRRPLGHEDVTLDAHGRKMVHLGPNDWIDFGPASEPEVFTVVRPHDGPAKVFSRPATDLLDLFDGDDRDRVAAWVAAVFQEMGVMERLKAETGSEVLGGVPTLAWDRVLTAAERDQLTEYLRAVGITKG